MNNWTKSVFFCLLLLLCAAAVPAQGPAGAATRAVYTLPPDKLRMAEELFRIRTLLHFGGAAWGVVQLLLLLSFGIVARLRDVAVRVSRNRWAQCYLFTFLLLAVTEVLNLPLQAYGHHMALRYGLSVQGWASWMGDLAKNFVLGWGPTGLGAMLIFWLIRRSPRRWWLWFWFPAMTAVIFGVLIAPVLIDPLFNHFEPLAAHDPALVTQLERVVARGPLTIGPERMFWMQASAKTTGLNAYVTGLGPSKRVVVWDTSIAKATPEEIALIFGHEMGHYALRHIYSTLVYVGALLLAAFWLGFHAAHVLIRRYGAAWGIASQGDWAALAVYLMVLAVLTFVSEPLVNGFSRAHEHAADVYGQEAVHGVVANPQAVAASVFQILGENSLVDPRPHPLVEFWSDTHPSISQRVAFAGQYNPWLSGGHGRYFPQ